VVVEAGRRLSANRQTQMAAAISYRTLFSIFPALLLAVSILGLVLRDDERREKVIDAVLDRFPLTSEAGVDLDGLITGVPTPASAAGIASILILLWSASGVMSTARVALQAAWGDDHGRPLVPAKLVDLAFVLAIGLLFLVSVALTIAAQLLQEQGARLETKLGIDLPAIEPVLAFVIPFLLSLSAFTLFYRYVPLTRPQLRDVLGGALIAAVGFELLKFGFAVYVREFASYDAVYGSLGAVIAFLFFVYLAAIVFLYGGEFAYAWHRDRAAPAPAAPAGAAEEPSVPLAEKVKGLLRGLFVGKQQ
jgi:membrane protein